MKMHASNIWAVALLGIVLASCDSHVYSGFQGANMETVRWEHGKTYTYNFEINEAGKHHIMVGVRHHARVNYNSLKLSAKLTMPDGTVEEKPFELLIRDAAGKFVGEVNVDVGDVDQVIFVDHQLDKGKYKLEINQHETQSKDQGLVGLFGVNVVVDSAEEKE